MPVYSYELTKTSKKTKNPVTRTLYMYSGRYVDKNTGKKINYKKRGFENKKDALSAERTFLNTIKDENVSKMTFAELSECYISDMMSRRKESTIFTTKGHLDTHIIPIIGNIDLMNITPRDIMRFQTVKLEEGYSVSYINSLTSTLKKVLNHAVKFYGLKNNNATNIEKLKDNSIKEENDFIYWNETDFKEFVKVADDEQYLLFYTTLFFTGLRRGEALALNWKDINLKNKNLSVRKTVTNKVSKDERKQGITYKITPPKTNNSMRTISLPTKLVDQLIEWKHNCEKYDGFDNNCFVFGIFKPLPYVTVDRKIKQWAEIAGIPKLSPHGLRHSHISFLINNGINILAVAKRAGDTVQIILQVYAHLFKENEDEVLKIMNDKY